MKRLFCLLLSFAATVMVVAQVTVSGVVEDSLSHECLRGVNVTLLRDGKPLKFTRTDDKGKFSINIGNVQKGDEIQTTLMGYKKRKSPISSDELTFIRMVSQEFSLQEVQVKGSRVFGVQDTITFDLTRFANERDNSLKDVLKKLPGVDVLDNGQVNYNGKAIDRFTVEGLDMTGGMYGSLTENIKAKDVEKAEIIENDQPIKALKDKVFSDDVALNIGLKDKARDRLMTTLKPYFMVGEPTHVGGSASILQIGKQRQLMYEAAYDRTGCNLATSNYLLAHHNPRLSGATLPLWLTVPALSSPLDDERLRFNTSQKYSINHIQKDKKDDEWRIATSYLRSVIRQQTANKSTYELGETEPVETHENESLLLKNDDFIGEMEHKVNTEKTFGNDYFKISASQADGFSLMNDTLDQRIRVPEVNVEGSIYRLFSIGGDQFSWRSVADFHHSMSDLYVNGDRTRINTRVWNTEHELILTLKRRFLTHHYTGGFSFTNLHALTNETRLGFSLSPSWYYKCDKFAVSFAPSVLLTRFLREQEYFFLPRVLLYMSLKTSRRSNWNVHSAFFRSVGSMGQFAYESYRTNYRTYTMNEGVVPQNKQFSAGVSYNYKRPIMEMFFNAELSVSRLWMNTAIDMQVRNGNYFYSLRQRNNKSDFLTAKMAISKGFFDLHLKTKLGANYTYSEGEQLSGNALLDYKSNFFRLTPNIEFSPCWGALSYNGDLNWNKTEIRHSSIHARQSSPSTLFNWRQQLSLTVTIGKMDISCLVTHYHRELREDSSFNIVLADAIAVWRRRRFRVSASLRNLFDRRDYKETFYSGISTSTTTYHLRGRELVLALQYAF